MTLRRLGGQPVTFLTMQVAVVGMPGPQLR